MKRALILFATIVTMTSCVPHHTSATQVGVRFNKMTGSVERADPGATYFFAPFVNDWKTFDVSTQNLVMTAQSDTGDRSGKDDLRFKTRDGNDIETDVTVRWRVDPARVEFLWKEVGPSTADIKDRLIRPLARGYVRDVLNRLDSEEFYNPDLRFRAAAFATETLADHLKPYGVIIEQVILGDFAFKSEYQNLINQRKEAEKQAEKLEAEILATREANQANLQSKIAELTQHLTAANGQLAQARRAADAYLVQKQQAARATTIEKTAIAEGIRRERAALNGSAGDAYVTLQLIDALKDKEIRQIPRLPNGNVIVDGNKLLQQLGVIRYQNQKDEQ
ncbi:MAG TPA: SPFH domain-containing protein [Thermoanaerobaculia bacterium]|nr:SPFH domain-containing protein [Thermoanaerobaculia bacterium]